MILIGIDDTDNKESRGTGFRARQLGSIIEKKNLGSIKSISRHQLFYDPRIPYTSQNSSACLTVNSNHFLELIDLSAEFLLHESAEGSDAGLSVAHYDSINESVLNWGNRAKFEVLTQKEARLLAEESDIFLEGYTGNKDGIIGSLAAIGLKKGGNDGRCVWLEGEDIRDLKGNYSVSELFKLINIDSIIDRSGKEIQKDKIINVGDWLRPIIKNSKIMIIVDKLENNKNYEYRVSSKDYIKSISD